MTPQEEQFLQAAQTENFDYVKEQASKMNEETLQLALVYTLSITIARYLILNFYHKINVNTYVWETDNAIKLTALYKACENHNLQKIKWLLKDGGAIVDLPIKVINNGIEQDDESPLMCAAKRQDFIVMDLLLQAGADENYKDAQGRTVYDLAPYTVEWIPNYKKRHLKKYFPKAIQQGDVGFVRDNMEEIDQPLLIKSFVHTPSVEIAKLLKDSGIDINVAEQGEESFQVCHREWKYPALATACKENFIEKAQWLISEGADINAYWYAKTFVAGMANVDDIYRLTPLMWAVKNRNIALIQLLVNAGADVNLKGHNGDINLKDCTALDIAKEYNLQDYTAIANLLKSAGAKE